MKACLGREVFYHNPRWLQVKRKIDIKKISSLDEWILNLGDCDDSYTALRC